MQGWSEDARVVAGPLARLVPVFSDVEPAVNRYGPGGAFKPHTDNFSITLNVLLCDVDSFEGGGPAGLYRSYEDSRATVEAAEAVVAGAEQASTVVDGCDLAEAEKAEYPCWASVEEYNQPL